MNNDPAFCIYGKIDYLKLIEKELVSLGYKVFSNTMITTPDEYVNLLCLKDSILYLFTSPPKDVRTFDLEKTTLTEIKKYAHQQLNKVTEPLTKIYEYTSIKTFEDACEKLGYGEKFELFFDSLENNETAFIKLNVIIRALNNGWIPNWNDSSEYKYWNYLNVQEGFSDFSTFYSYTFTIVSSALCFKSRVIAEYAAKQFIDLYKQLYN